MSEIKKSQEKHQEKTLGKILQIINRRKSILILSTIICLILAGVYSFTTNPVYEATVVLKKDIGQNTNSPSDLMNIVNLQSPDEIETEMELVETWSVFSKVIDNLNLYLYVKKIESGSGRNIIINKSLIDYYNPDYFNHPPDNISLPQFVEVKLKDLNSQSSLYIEVEKDNSYKLYNAENDSLLYSTNESGAGVFNTEKLSMVIYWPIQFREAKYFLPLIITTVLEINLRR